MRNKGFTLIELLAVIVILSILALIAIPRIADIIDNSEESATLSGGRNYLRAVEQAILNKNLKEKFNPRECEIQSDGNLVCDGKLLEIDMTGTRPTEGTITIEKKVPVAVDGMLLDGYLLNMKEFGNLEMFGRIEDIKPQGTYLMIATNNTNSDTTFLDQDKINRSEVESIVIKNRKKVPSNAIYSWDVSAAKDSSVIAWYTDIDNNGLYELYIGGDGGVKANPNSQYLFKYFDSATIIDVTYLNTEDVTNMLEFFCTSKGSGKSSLKKIIGLNRFNTSKVTNMSTMFGGCKSLETIDVSSFDTSKVTTMYGMFDMTPSSTGSNGDYSKLRTLDLSNFDTGNVTSMQLMFENCSSLTELNIKNFDTSNVTSMHSMFASCNNLINIIGLEKFNTNKITIMDVMFKNCNKITNLDLNNFDTSNVKSMSGMFYNCTSLKNVVFGKNFKVDNTITVSDMFNSCSSLTTLDLSVFSTSKVTSMNYMFSQCQNLNTINLKNASFNTVTSYVSLFGTTTSLSSITVKDEAAKAFIEARLADVNKTGVTVTIAT